MLCRRGSHAAEIVYSEHRLRSPMKRVGPKGSRQFEGVSWDDTYDIIVDNLQRIAEESGPEAVATYTGRGAFELSLCDMYQPQAAPVSSTSNVLFPFGSRLLHDLRTGVPAAGQGHRSGGRIPQRLSDHGRAGATPRLRRDLSADGGSPAAAQIPTVGRPRTRWGPLRSVEGTAAGRTAAGHDVPPQRGDTASRLTAGMLPPRQRTIRWPDRTPPPPSPADPFRRTPVAARRPWTPRQRETPAAGFV